MRDGWFAHQGRIVVRTPGFVEGPGPGRGFSSPRLGVSYHSEIKVVFFLSMQITQVELLVMLVLLLAAGDRPLIGGVLRPTAARKGVASGPGCPLITWLS